MSINKVLRRMLLEASLPNQEEIDRVLDKISNQGINSLSPEDKRVLDNSDAKPDTRPYQDPYNDDADQDEEYLKLKANIMKMWGTNLMLDKVDYITKDENMSVEVVEFYFETDSNQVMTYYTDTQTLAIRKDDYSQLMKGVYLNGLDDITQAFAAYLDGAYDIGPVRNIQPF